MKKLTMFILSAAMIAGLSVSAWASTTEIKTETEKSRYDSDGTGTPSADSSVNTELWLQVEASGQIDVTVPLVLIFKTDLDGGSATSPSSYKITNNSTAPIAVTKIKRTVEAQSAANPMTLVGYEATPGEDEYKVRLSVDGGNWDLEQAEHSRAAQNGGLFSVPKQAANDGNSGETVIQATMATGKLSFVTGRDASNNLDPTKGVKLMTVTYTVALDTSGAIGEEITSADENFKAQ